MKKPVWMLHSKWVVGLVVSSLSLLGIISMPSVANALGPGTVCVLQIEASGNVLAVLVDQATNFTIAVLVPEDPDKRVNVPVTCESLETLGLAVANQRNNRVTVTTQVFTNQGELICFNGSVGVPRNGARGMLFSGCQ